MMLPDAESQSKEPDPLMYQVGRFVEATDSKKWFTYDEYSRYIASYGDRTAVTIEQWQTIVSLADLRPLQSDTLINQIKDQIIKEFYDKDETKKQSPL